MKYIFNSPKIILIYISIFLIIYLEPINIGGFKFAHIWKIFFEFVLLIVILHVSSRESSELRKLPKSIYLGYLFAIYPLFIATIYDPIPAFVTIGTRLMPVMLVHLLFISRVNQSDLLKWFSHIPVFLVLSALPFLANLLEPLGKKAYDLSDFSDLGGQGFIGIFQTVHSASLTFALASIIAITLLIERHFIVLGKKFLFLLSIFLVTLLLGTFARSGWLALGIGLLSYFVTSKKSKIILYVIPMLILVIIVVDNTYGVSTIRNRLTGETLRLRSKQVQITFDARTSGRLTLWENSIYLYMTSNPLTLLIGTGETEFLENMEVRLGIKVFSHNGFINELVIRGIIGFIIMMLFFRAIYLDIMSNKNKMKHIGLSLFSAFMVFIFFQGADAPLQLFIMFSAISFTYAPLGIVHYSCDEGKQR